MALMVVGNEVDQSNQMFVVDREIVTGERGRASQPVPM
jgi:hypothetical protein